MSIAKYMWDVQAKKDSWDYIKDGICGGNVINLHDGSTAEVGSVKDEKALELSLAFAKSEHARCLVPRAPWYFNSKAVASLKKTNDEMVNHAEWGVESEVNIKVCERNLVVVHIRMLTHILISIILSFLEGRYSCLGCKGVHASKDGALDGTDNKNSSEDDKEECTLAMEISSGISKRIVVAEVSRTICAL